MRGQGETAPVPSSLVTLVAASQPGQTAGACRKARMFVFLQARPGEIPSLLCEGGSGQWGSMGPAGNNVLQKVKLQYKLLK